MSSQHRKPERAPGLLLRMLEGRAWSEGLASLYLMPFWALSPQGDGHPVLVLPGLGAGDESTVILRTFLGGRGYAVYPWNQGPNFGLRAGVKERLRQQLVGIAKEHRCKVSIVGWSLGGIFARELAKDEPECVRLVITLGSPFTGHPKETNAWRFYEWVSGHRIGAPEIHEPLRIAPDVPTTSIWSRSDGVVSYRCSIERTPGQTENIEVFASHFGMGAHPAVMYAIADRLALPEGRWRPFRRDKLLEWFFPDPEREVLSMDGI